MNVPKAFYTGRVTEALDSLAKHVTAAFYVANDIDPIRPAKLVLEDEESRLIIKSIKIEKQDANGLSFMVTGKNLSKKTIQGFELFLEDDPGIVLKVDISHLDLNPLSQFKATFVGRIARSGSYEVRITDGDGISQLPGFSFTLKASKVKAQAQASRDTSGTTGAAPVVDIQSPSQGQVILTALMPGEGPYFYQWFRNGVVIQDATHNEHVLSDPNDEAIYAVVVADTSGSIVTSIPAKLGRHREK